MSARILVLGNTGMLGYMVSKVLSKEREFEVCGTHISDPTDLFYFDVEEGLERLALICRISGEYDYVINCIGITADRINSYDSLSLIKAVKINSLFPHQLAEFAIQRNIRIIHISTDGVFSNVAGCCSEDAPHDCTDIYGKTKSLGEVTSEKFLNIRCSIIGPSPFERRGLFEWFRSQPEESEVRGYTNHVWNGVTTLQFAQLCKQIIEDGEFDNIMRESCIHHFCPNCEVTKYELLTAFNRATRSKRNIVSCENEKYPLNRVLTTKFSSLRKIFGSDKDMQAAINELFDSIIINGI